MKHRFGELTGLSILLAGMVSHDKRESSESGVRSSECLARRNFVDFTVTKGQGWDFSSVQSQGSKGLSKGYLTEWDDDLHLL